MSKKEKVEPIIEAEATKAVEAFKYGVAPFLTIIMVRDNRTYRFEMPIGAQLAECKEACTECIGVIKKMTEEAEARAAEEAKKEKENSEDIIE